MKRFITPVVLILLALAFCAYSWHAVETGLNKGLREEATSLTQQVAAAEQAQTDLQQQVEQYKSNLLAALPEHSKEIEALFVSNFGTEEETQELVEE